MSTLFYNIVAIVLALGVLYGISLMSSPKTAVKGNQLGALAVAIAIVLTLLHDGSMSVPVIWISIIIGSALGLFLAKKVTMLQMPQLVALLNGFGGAASAFVALLAIVNNSQLSAFARFNAGLALSIGMITLAGSLVAAGKLHQLVPQKPVHLKAHNLLSNTVLGLNVVLLLLLTTNPSYALLYSMALFLFASIFGLLFTIRVGGADMPVTISLLNSFSGVAGGIAGIAIADPLLVAVGGIVGASGLLLTQIMCRAMNRSLIEILLGKTTLAGRKESSGDAGQTTSTEATYIEHAEIPFTVAKEAEPNTNIDTKLMEILQNSKRVIIIPGYGMALAQAQHKVKELAEFLEERGASVFFAIHPVAGRMPGHMNVLLAEADVDYEKLLEMDEANQQFAETDLSIIVGANDVVNPAASTAEGTPIYGMPILDASSSKQIIVCNFDKKPGYAGVENPLYEMEKATLLLGDAVESVEHLLFIVKQGSLGDTEVAGHVAFSDTNAVDLDDRLVDVLQSAKKVILVPGYGMALAQAQHKVKELAQCFEERGASVFFAIHPVAGRMPGHMNVLLAEADVDYEKLLEMDEANQQFAETDLSIIVGANDVVNPAASTAEGTPIYGMPILEASLSKQIIVCNFDKKPGYAGVDNPLYEMEKATLLLGDAVESVERLIKMCKRT